MNITSRLRDDLAARRRARTAGQSLRRQLESYTTPAQVDDLLAAIADQEGPEVDTMRRILARNRMDRLAS